MTDVSTDLDASTKPPVADDRLSREQVLAIGTLLVSCFVVILNETVMSIALPVLQDDLGVQPTQGQWLTTAFMLTMAVIIPLTGFLISRIDTRRLFVIAMSLFTVGTVLAFFSPGFVMLLVARIVQASGTAIMLPLLMTTIMTIVPPARRGAMMGNITIVISVAPALGPTISGIILENFSWHWIFGFVAPIAVVALVLGAKYVTPITQPGDVKADLLSVPLSVLGFAGLVYGLVGIGESAQGDPAIPLWIPFVVGGVSLVAFIVRQILLGRQDRALLDLRVFGSTQFSIAIGAMVIAMASMFGAFLLLPLFAQEVLELSTLKSGLLTLPGGLLMALSGPYVGRIYDAHGPRVLTLPGALLVSAGVWMLTMIDTDTSIWWLVLSNMVLMAGLSGTFTPLMTSSLGSVAPHLYSHASAVVGTLQQVAGAAGAALFITVMTVRATSAGKAGASGAESLTEGIQSAFMVGGFMSLLLIVAVLFVRKAEAPAH